MMPAAEAGVQHQHWEMGRQDIKRCRYSGEMDYLNSLLISAQTE